MTNVKLTDFTADELQTLLTAVMLMQSPKMKLTEHDEREHLHLWQVQILNAISTVKMREDINSN